MNTVPAEGEGSLVGIGCLYFYDHTINATPRRQRDARAQAHIARGRAPTNSAPFWAHLSGGYMRRELTTEEKRWCLEQAIAMVKEVGHGGAASMREAADALQSLYHTLYALYQTVQDDASGLS